MLLDKKPYTFDSVVRLAITLGMVYMGYLLIKHLSTVLIPFAIALLLAYLINPLVLLVQRVIKRRMLAVLLTLLVLFIVMVLAISAIVPIIANEIRHLGSLMTNLIEKSDLADQAAQRLPPNLWQAFKTYLARDEVQFFLKTENFFTLAQGILKKILPGIWGIVSGATSIIIGAVGLMIILLYIIFLLRDFQSLRKDWKQMIPAPYRTAILEFIDDFNDAMKRYFRAQTLIAAIVGLISAIGFTIIGLPLGFLFGLFVGLLNMVPYLQVLSYPPAIVLALIRSLENQSSFGVSVALVLLVFAVAQIIQDAFLVPRIQGKAIGLSPWLIILSLSIWGKLLGFLGLIIALPMTFLLLAYYRKFLRRLTKSAIKEEPV